MKAFEALLNGMTEKDELRIFVNRSQYRGFLVYMIELRTRSVEDRPLKKRGRGATLNDAAEQLGVWLGEAATSVRRGQAVRYPDDMMETGEGPDPLPVEPVGKRLNDAIGVALSDAQEGELVWIGGWA